MSPGNVRVHLVGGRWVPRWRMDLELTPRYLHYWRNSRRIFTGQTGIETALAFMLGVALL